MDEQRQHDQQDRADATGQLGEAELEEASGGMALLLPAIQKVREAAALPEDGTSNTSVFGERL